MNRQIKFRAWTGKDMLDGEQLIHSTNLFISPANGNLINPKEPSRYFMDKCILLQFTGLKDKNGKEIYEGDIVKGWEDNYEVKWQEDSAKFVLITRKEFLNILIGDGQEVIGNIYENPELIGTESGGQA